MAYALKLLLPSFPRCCILIRGTRGRACRPLRASRYKYYKENKDRIWDNFFADPSRFLDHRNNKAQERFADFTLKGDSTVALYIENDFDIQERLRELDSLDPALKASCCAHLLPSQYIAVVISYPLINAA